MKTGHHGTLEPVVAKLARAAEHYHFLKWDLNGGLDRTLREITVKSDDDGLGYSFRVGEIEPLDPRWPAVIGDCLHNLRSALDYLAFQLHVRRYRGNVPPDAIEESGFPIKVDAFNSKGNPINLDASASISRLSERDKAAIKWLQPFNHRRDKLESLRRMLGEIHMLDIIDKHRDLHLVRKSVVAIQMPPREFAAEYGFRSDVAFREPLESFACVDRWTFTKIPPQAQINMNRKVYDGVFVDEAGGPYEIIRFLGGSVLGVWELIQRFSDRFPPITPPDWSWVRSNDGVARSR